MFLQKHSVLAGNNSNLHESVFVENPGTTLEQWQSMIALFFFQKCPPNFRRRRPPYKINTSWKARQSVRPADDLARNFVNTSHFEFHVHFGFFEVAAIFLHQSVVLDLLNPNPFVGKRQRCPKVVFSSLFFSHRITVKPLPRQLDLAAASCHFPAQTNTLQRVRHFFFLPSETSVQANPWFEGLFILFSSFCLFVAFIYLFIYLFIFLLHRSDFFFVFIGNPFLFLVFIIWRIFVCKIYFHGHQIHTWLSPVSICVYLCHTVGHWVINYKRIELFTCWRSGSTITVFF